MTSKRVRVPLSEVVFVKGILEASEGLATMFAERGGDLTIAAPPDRAAELDRLLADLQADCGAEIITTPEPGR